MKIWIASSISLTRFLKKGLVFLVLAFLFVLLGQNQAMAQSRPDSTQRHELQSGNTRVQPEPAPKLSMKRDTVPRPRKVLLKSAIIPGWGQVVNKQYWKVPIIYGALVGLSWYSVQMTKNYHEFRAAYYNSLSDPSRNYHSDQRFGPTPAYLVGQSADALKYYRNYYRNTRDMVYLGIGLAYGLNIIDAYVYAQMRDFDVSNNLSVQASIVPQNIPAQGTGVGLQLTFRLKAR